MADSDAGKPGKAKALHWILTHSRSEKIIVVKRVSHNRGLTLSEEKTHITHISPPNAAPREVKFISVFVVISRVFLFFCALRVMAQRWSCRGGVYKIKHKKV
ncbi:hypothetical protein SU60_02790 [Vibrio mytili]|uniref:Uncharacterized protein n=1 Tax=Vibrio mytili TaxID=50718 RepID=A0A0C3ECS1_9VIBR|nr:hypothetical protein SU60_02790 [Vibrio mytili]